MDEMPSNQNYTSPNFSVGRMAAGGARLQIVRPVSAAIGELIVRPRKRMLAFEIYVNKVKVCTAARDELEYVGAQLFSLVNGCNPELGLRCFFLSENMIVRQLCHPA